MGFLDNTGLIRLWEHIMTHLNDKVSKVTGKDLSTNDYTDAEKTKLAGIATGATKVTVDSALSTTSTNPVQNKIITSEINDLNTLVGDTPISEQISEALADKSDVGHSHTISEVTDVTATAAELNVLDGITATTAELNYVDGVTSNIQTQLDNAVDDSITGLSVSGKVITYTKGDGSTGTITTQDRNTSQTLSTTDAEYSMLFKSDTSALDFVANTQYTTGVTVNPSTKTVTATTFNGDLSGNAATATTATSATSATTATTATTAYKALSEAGTTTAGDGAAYTATISGITSLTTGVSFIMIPHVVSTSATPTLNVNSLGAKTIRRRVSNSTATTTTGYSAGWLAASKPVRVTYDGTYWIADLPSAYASDIFGTVPVTKGGTGANTAAAALTNLGAVSKAGDTMTGHLNATRFRVWNDDTPMYVFGNSSGSPFGEITIGENNQMRFGYRHTAGDQNIEYYYLPKIESSITSSAWYDILTSKDPVTIAQGGTGASNASSGLHNLAYRGICSDCNAATTTGIWACNTSTANSIPNMSRYGFLIVVSTGDWIRQQYCGTGGDVLYERYKINNANWMAWSEIVTSKNTAISNTSAGTIAGVQSFNIGSANVCMGITDEISVPANGYVDTTITFPKAFGTFPRVMVCDYYNNTTVSNIMNIHSVIASVNATTMTIRTANGGSGARTVRASWQAIGPA